MRGRHDGDPLWKTEVITMAKPRNLCRAEKKELKILARDFGLFHIKEVQEIIESCSSYSKGQRGIMRIYNQVYM